MRQLFLPFSLGLMLFGLSNCGGPVGSHNKAVELANQKSVDDLALLISNHPELSQANLQEVKNAAKNIVSENTSEISYALDNPSAEKNSVALKPEVAKKAQNLIDDILDQFDFAKELSARFKLMGILINIQNERLKQFEAHAKSFGSKGEGDSSMSKFDPNFAPKEMSCEAFLANPFIKIPKETYDQVARANKELIKKTISGCPNLVTEKFVQCISDFNHITGLVDQHASCELKSIEELEQVLDKNMEGKYQQKSEALKDCLSVQFAGCGFEIQKVPQN